MFHWYDCIHIYDRHIWYMGFRQIVQGCKLITEIQPSLYLFRLFSATIVTSQNSLDNRSKSILANHLQSGEVDLAESGRPDHSGILMERDNISWNIMSKESGIQWDSMGMACKTRLDYVQMCPKHFDSVERLAVSVMRSALLAKIQNKLRFQHSPDRMAPKTMIVSSALSLRLITYYLWTYELHKLMKLYRPPLNCYKLLAIGLARRSERSCLVMRLCEFRCQSDYEQLGSVWFLRLLDHIWSFSWNNGRICGYFGSMATVKPVNPANVSIESGPKMTASSNLAAFASMPWVPCLGFILV